MKSNWSITTYLLLLVGLGYVATDIYLPSLPAIGNYFDASDRDVKMTLFTYLLSFSFSPLLFGPLSDHFGRKKVLLGGILVTLLATIACLFSQNIYWLIALRFFQGIGAGAVMIAGRASVSDLFTGKELTRQMSLMSMLMPFILAVAPTIGGALQESFGWQSVFIFLSVFTGFIFMQVLFREETIKKTSDKKISQIFSTYRCHLKNRLFVSFAFNFIFPALGFFSYLTVSPFLFQEVIGLSPFEYGTLSLYVGGIILVTGYINLKLIHHFPLTQIIRAGMCLILLAGCLLLAFHYMNILTTWSVLGPVLIFFTCVPLCSANSLSQSLRFVQKNFGAATALLTTCQLLVGACTSYVFSFLSNDTALPLALCFVLVGVLSLINLKYAADLENNMDLQDNTQLSSPTHS